MSYMQGTGSIFAPGQTDIVDFLPPVLEDVDQKPNGVTLIGLWSPAPQSGKSTAADALIAGGQRGEVISFAAPLRRIIGAILTEMGVPAGVIYDRVYAGRDKELPIPGVGKSFVELAIKIGTDVGRGWIGEGIWTDAFRRRVEAVQRGRRLIVVDDVRFPNEAALVRELGGIMLGIERPGTTVSAQRAAAEGRLGCQDMTAVVVNGSDRETFRRAVVETARMFGAAV